MHSFLVSDEVVALSLEFLADSTTKGDRRIIPG